MRQMMDSFYQTQYTPNARIWMEGAIDARFKVGDQQLYNIFGMGQNLTQQQKFFLNLIRRHLMMVGGYQRKNRKSTVTLPIHEGDDPLADDYNKVLRWSEDRSGYQEYKSQAFEGCITTGMNLLHLYPDYTLDPVSGDLFDENISYNNYVIDINFRKQDLTDCNGIYRRRWVSKQKAMTLLRGYESEIKKMKAGGMKDGKFPLQAELMNLQLSNLMTYDEFHYATTRMATMIIDPMSGEAVEWEQEKDDEADMMERTLAQQPWLIVKKMEIPTVEMGIALGGKIVYKGKNLLGIDQYPFVPEICFHEPDIMQYGLRIMGMVRNLRDPQFLYNMRKIIELQILQSQINAGWIFPVDAVTDVKAFRQASGGDGFLVPLKAGHLPNEIQRIEPSAIPESLMALSASLSEDLTKISGVSEELLGAATDDKSGILSMLRQGANLTTLQSIFDRSDYSQRLYGKIRLQAIRKNFSKGKIRNILGHDPDPRFFTSTSLKYSIAVEEGNYSTTQRQMELQQLLHFKELGMPIANKSIMRASFISNKKQVMQDMEEEVQQQQQQQQAEMQQQGQKDQAEIMGKMAKAQLDSAKVQETFAKIDDLEATAEHKKMESDYGLVRMMLELEEMDFNNYKASFLMAETIKKKQEKEREKNQMPVMAGG